MLETNSTKLLQYAGVKSRGSGGRTPSYRRQTGDRRQRPWRWGNF